MTTLTLGVREATAMVGLSPWTIREYITQGKLACVRIGRRVLVPVNDTPDQTRRIMMAMASDAAQAEIDHSPWCCFHFNSGSEGCGKSQEIEVALQ
jgi:excisionase family DNA binding protein